MAINNDPNQINNKITQLETELAHERAKLGYVQNSCSHVWSEPRYTPDIKKGYTIPGARSRYGGGYIPYDEAPYMDDTVVPDKETPKWTRRCTKCGKEETTTRVSEKVNITTKPVF